MSMNRYLTRRDFLRASGAALILSTAMPKGLRAEPPKIPVLLYHDISDQFEDGYTISPSRFATQMEWLYSQGYRTLSLRDIGGSIGRSAEKAIVITFDDGYASFMDYAFPLLTEYGFKATINIIGEYVGTFMRFGGNRPMLSWDEYRYLIKSGRVDLGCHTHSLHYHRGVLHVSRRQLRDDLRLFSDVFEKETGRKTDLLAWPFGIYNPARLETAKKAGFKYFLTSYEGSLSVGAGFDEVPRLNINNKLDMVSFKQYIG